MWIIFSLLFLLIPQAHALTIVSVTTEDRFLSREEITPGCEWIDRLVRVVTTTYRDVIAIVGPMAGLQQDGPGYQPRPNICFDDSIPLEDKPWCIPPHFVPTMGGQGPTPFSGFRTWTVTEFFPFSVTTNTCDHCTPVPEPATVCLAGIGLVYFGGKLKRQYGRRSKEEI